VDGQEQNQDAISRDYQKYLETHILKFNYRAFTQIVVLGSKSFIPFMKLAKYDRRAVIENLLDIQIFSLMNTVAKADLVKAREALEENKRQIESTKEQIALQQKYVEDAKKNNQELVVKIQEDIADHQRQLTTLELNITLQQKEAEELLLCVSDKSKVESTLRQLEAYEAKIDQKRSISTRQMEFYRDNDNCPTCKQNLEDNFKFQAMVNAEDQVHQFEKALAQLEDEKNKLNERLSDIRDIMKKLNKVQADINSMNVSKHHIYDYIAKRTREIADLSNKTVLSEDMMEVSKHLLDKYQTHNDARKGLVENRAYYEVAVNLLKDGGIKAQIIKQYLPVINTLVNKYLTSMDFFVNFELNEEFEETIKSRHRDQFTYDSFSEGEKQKIDIALLFAWRAVAKLKNSMNTNLLILDEIFDSSLDGVGADLVLSILGTMPQGSNVFIISHRELLHDRFTNTIRFEKRNNFSQIVNSGE
jgi:DNA repair exonuclease SbcCD ATPase subunit